MFTRLKLLGVAVVGATLMAASPARAATVIDFSTGLAGAGGTITWTGTHLIGNNIPIGAVTIDGAPSNNGVLLVSGLVPGSGGGMYGDLDFNTTPGSNFISITGCIPGLSIGTIDGSGNCTAGDMLLFGDIDGWNVANAGNGLLGAFGDDLKSTELVEAIGAPVQFPWTWFGISFVTSPLAPGGSGPVISTDIRNTQVPEPATMILLGTGLLAAFRARRRQQQA